jgi:hypothetical protein
MGGTVSMNNTQGAKEAKEVKFGKPDAYKNVSSSQTVYTLTGMIDSSDPVPCNKKKD